MIDYVVPMVFHQDMEWRDALMSAGRRYDETNTEEFVRYRSWGTEQLLVKCVKRFMPWIRTIYVLLAQESQKQPWMDDEEVRVVYHEEFIPKKFLPTFNSRCIEMFLKNIPDISELFIYGNDDMYPVAPLKEEDFFVDGKPCLHYTEKPFPEAPNAYHIAALGGLNFIAGQFGKRYNRTWLKGGHNLTPMVKSTWEKLWNDHREKIEHSITPFRDIKNYNQWLCPWWHFLSGNYFDHSPKRCYTGTRKSVEEVVATIHSDIQVVCVNDNECEKDYMKYGRAVRRALEEKLETDGRS